MKRFWVDYTSEAFSRLPHERLIAVLPLGAVEQHGPHLPLSVDACVAETLARRLAEALPEDSPAIFLPVQSIAKSNEHGRYPGTLTLSAGTVIRAWCEIGACVAGDPEGRVDVAAALTHLGARGLAHVLVEGGSRLLGTLFAADLVDEVVVFIAPRVMGPGVPAVDAPPQASRVLPWALDEATVHQLGSDIMVRGRRPQTQVG